MLASEKEMPNLNPLWLITIMETDVPYSHSDGISHFPPIELSRVSHSSVTQCFRQLQVINWKRQDRWDLFNILVHPNIF